MAFRQSNGDTFRHFCVRYACADDASRDAGYRSQAELRAAIFDFLLLFIIDAFLAFTSYIIVL